MSRLLLAAQVAEMLVISEKTLANWRGAKTGPPFVKAGNE